MTRYRPRCNSVNRCPVDPATGRGRASPWFRIQAINDTLYEFEQKGEKAAVLYLDSDAYISNHELVISKVTAPMSVWENEVRSELCSGTMVFTNAPKTFEILSSWWNEPNKKYDFSWPWEQGVLNKYVLSKYSRDIVMLPSIGWATPGLKWVSWDSGILLNTPMDHFTDQPYVLNSTTMKYKHFIRHMWQWATMPKQKNSVLMHDFNLIKPGDLNVKFCSSSSRFFDTYCAVN